VVSELYQRTNQANNISQILKNDVVYHRFFFKTWYPIQGSTKLCMDLPNEICNGENQT